MVHKMSGKKKRAYNCNYGAFTDVEYHLNRKSFKVPVINGYSFTPNGPKNKHARYFKCSIPECNVRLIIYDVNPNRGYLVEEHQHKSSFQGRQIQLGHISKRFQLLTAVIIIKKLNSCNSEDSQSAESIPQIFTEEIQNCKILTQQEKNVFRAMSLDQLNENIEKIENSIEIMHCRFGFGVFATMDLPSGSLIGCYAGSLSRKLSENSRYSFEITVSSKKLFLDAEATNSRSILA